MKCDNCDKLCEKTYDFYPAGQPSIGPDVTLCEGCFGRLPMTPPKAKQRSIRMDKPLGGREEQGSTSAKQRPEEGEFCNVHHSKTCCGRVATLPLVTGEEYQAMKEELERVMGALKMLYEETADYIRINHLGNVHHNQSMKLARKALSAHEGG